MTGKGERDRERNRTNEALLYCVIHAIDEATRTNGIVKLVLTEKEAATIMAALRQQLLNETHH